MNKELFHYNLRLISEQLTTEQIIFSRRNRNWQKFDKSNEIVKLSIRLEELQYFEDFLDSNYIPENDRR
jgi:hypothetical protein